MDKIMSIVRLPKLHEEDPAEQPVELTIDPHERDITAQRLLSLHLALLAEAEQAEQWYAAAAAHKARCVARLQALQGNADANELLAGYLKDNLERGKKSADVQLSLAYRPELRARLGTREQQDEVICEDEIALMAHFVDGAGELGDGAPFDWVPPTPGHWKFSQSKLRAYLKTTGQVPPGVVVNQRPPKLYVQALAKALPTVPPNVELEPPKEAANG